MTPERYRKAKDACHLAWQPVEPLILASNSQIRASMLSQVQINFAVEVAVIDEREIEKQIPNADGAEVAVKLAGAKAINVSKRHPGRYVLGADQICTMSTTRLHQTRNIAELRKQLTHLRGKRHTLTSAAAIACNGMILATICDTATLKMRQFSDPFLDWYIEVNGNSLLRSVGGYQIERMGQVLMSEIRGCRYTIMGLPLIPLLETLEKLTLARKQPCA